MTVAWCIFLFIFGACVGSFINVLVWRMPRLGWGSLISPPSHCPKCKHPLAWYDNVPVFGWIFLRGRCRYCREPISIRYPIVEFICGALFAFYYAVFFILHMRGMGSFDEQWPMYVLYMTLMSGLVAISLIDGELYIIPSELPWGLAVIGIVVHAIIDRPGLPGALRVGPFGGAVAAGGAIGLLVSLILYWTGIIKQSFPDGEPALEVDEAQWQEEVAEAKRQGVQAPPRPRVYTRKEIRAELGREMQFLLPPMLGALAGGLAVLYIKPLAAAWQTLVQSNWLSGMLGAILGALVGALIIWLARILGTLAFGRIAMGLGDVHLMFGIGAIIGAGPVTVAFFLAPFAGLLVGLWNLITRSRRELPYGPYLSLATAAVLVTYPLIMAQLKLDEGFEGLRFMLRNTFGGS